MNPLAHEVAERGIDLALPIDPIQPGEGGAFDRQREMAFTTRIMAGVPNMLVTLVLKLQPGRR